MTNRFLRSAALALATLTSAAVLTACGGGDDNALQPAAATTFNGADVTFAQQMIPHHSQAVKMASLAASRSENPAVKKLASAIVAGQGPEIETMQRLLATWGQPLVPDMEGMDHSAMAPEDMMNMSAAMPGMAEDQELKALAAAKGPKFDQMFLTMMIKHHQGALQMAKAEAAEGQDPEALALAKAMETTQQSEIKKMQKIKNA